MTQAVCVSHTGGGQSIIKFNNLKPASVDGIRQISEREIQCVYVTK